MDGQKPVLGDRKRRAPAELENVVRRLAVADHGLPRVAIRVRRVVPVDCGDGVLFGHVDACRAIGCGKGARPGHAGQQIRPAGQFRSDVAAQSSPYPRRCVLYPLFRIIQSRIRE